MSRKRRSPKREVHTIRVPYAQMGEKIGETERYLLLHHREAITLKFFSSGNNDIGGFLMVFAGFLCGAVHYGSCVEWEKLGKEGQIRSSLNTLAEVTAWILSYEEFEFSPEWGFTKKEVLEYILEKG